MNNSDNLRYELKTYLSRKPFFNIILPLDVFLVFGGISIVIINHFLNLGGLIYSIAYYSFILGLLLSFANNHDKYLYSGLFTYSAYYAMLVLQSAIFAKYKFLDFYSLITCLIFGYFAYLAYKKSCIK